MFSLCSTRAASPTARRLGTRVLHSAPSPPCDVAGISVAAAVTVGSSGAESVEAAFVLVDVAATAVAVDVGATVVGLEIASVDEGAEEGEEVGVLSDKDAVSVGTGRAAEGSVTFGVAITSVGLEDPASVAHPRRSIRSRIAIRIIVTTNLNRS